MFMTQVRPRLIHTITNFSTVIVASRSCMPHPASANASTSPLSGTYRLAYPRTSDSSVDQLR